MNCWKLAQDRETTMIETGDVFSNATLVADHLLVE